MAKREAEKHFEDLPDTIPIQDLVQALRRKRLGDSRRPPLDAGRPHASPRLESQAFTDYEVLHDLQMRKLVAYERNKVTKELRKVKPSYWIDESNAISTHHRMYDIYGVDGAGFLDRDYEIVVHDDEAARWLLDKEVDCGDWIFSKSALPDRGDNSPPAIPSLRPKADTELAHKHKLKPRYGNKISDEAYCRLWEHGGFTEGFTKAALETELRQWAKKNLETRPVSSTLRAAIKKAEVKVLSEKRGE